LGLCGPPGCGKTSLAVRGIGPALKDRPVHIISLGGAKDSSTLLGHDYTYCGSRPGRIVEAICSTEFKDCVIVFDELDKISDTATGREITSVLMSIIDPVQNKNFEDIYLMGVPIDLSCIICVFTFNDISLIDPILLDRLHVVHIKEMSMTEKKKVVREHMLPKIAKSLGVENTIMNDECVDTLLKTLDSGSLRCAEKTLERAILSANIRAIKKEKDANSLKIKCKDIPKRKNDKFNSMYA
jgi:ATP-dependent Lon protease